MANVRLSPSGPTIIGDLDTSSDGIANDSDVPDAVTLTQALNRLSANYSAIFDEDFCSGINDGNSGSTLLNVQTGFGNQNWTAVKESIQGVTRPTSAGGGLVIGAYNLAQTIGTYTTLGLGLSATAGTLLAGVGIPPRCLDYVYWKMFPNAATGLNGSSRAGLGSAATAGVTPLGQNAIYFDKLNIVPRQPWSLVCRRAGVTTVSQVLIDSTAGYTDLEMTRDSSTGTWSFFINGALVTTVPAASIPVLNVTPICQVDGVTLAIDRYQMRYTRRPP